MQKELAQVPLGIFGLSPVGKEMPPGALAQHLPCIGQSIANLIDCCQVHKFFVGSLRTFASGPLASAKRLIRFDLQQGESLADLMNAIAHLGFRIPI